MGHTRRQWHSAGTPCPAADANCEPEAQPLLPRQPCPLLVERPVLEGVLVSFLPVGGLDEDFPYACPAGFYGASLDALDEDQRDPLTTATHAGHAEARKALLRAARKGTGLRGWGVGVLKRIRGAFVRAFRRGKASKGKDEA